MSTPVDDALRTLVTEIVRAVVPTVLAEIAPQLAARDEDVVPVARAAELGLTPRVLADAIRRGDVAGIKLGRTLAAKRSEIIRWRDSRTFRPRRRATEHANDTSVADDIAADVARDVERLRRRA